jgi:hypothetical protein
MPFALLADDFRRAANFDMLSLVLDRHRLSAPPGVTENWVSGSLKRDLNTWTEKRLAALELVKEG